MFLNSCFYITKATSSLTNYSSTTAMNSAITNALTGYDTNTLRITIALHYWHCFKIVQLHYCNHIKLTNYSTTTTMNSDISTALTGYDTKASHNTTLISYPTTAVLNSCSYSSSASLGIYPLKAGDTISGALD
jgi:hypothetical protein